MVANLQDGSLSMSESCDAMIKLLKTTSRLSHLVGPTLESEIKSRLWVSMSVKFVQWKEEAEADKLTLPDIQKWPKVISYGSVVYNTEKRMEEFETYVTELLSSSDTEAKTTTAQDEIAKSSRVLYSLCQSIVDSLIAAYKALGASR